MFFELQPTRLGLYMRFWCTRGYYSIGAERIHADLFLLDAAAATAGWAWSWPFSILSNCSSIGSLPASMVWLFPSCLHSFVLPWPPCASWCVKSEFFWQTVSPISVTN
jgi:hypothetical protein